MVVAVEDGCSDDCPSVIQKCMLATPFFSLIEL